MVTEFSRTTRGEDVARGRFLVSLMPDVAACDWPCGVHSSHKITLSMMYPEVVCSSAMTTGRNEYSDSAGLNNRFTVPVAVSSDPGEISEFSSGSHF